MLQQFQDKEMKEMGKKLRDIAKTEDLESNPNEWNKLVKEKNVLRTLNSAWRLCLLETKDDVPDGLVEDYQQMCVDFIYIINVMFNSASKTSQGMLSTDIISPNPHLGKWYQPVG